MERDLYKLKNLANYYKREKNIGYGLIVSVSNTDKKLIEYFKLLFNGSFMKHNDKRKNRKELFVWQCSAKRAYDFLVLIKPYLKIKQEQLKIGVSFYKTYIKYYGIHSTPVNILNKREKYYNEIKRLKHINKKNIVKIKTKSISEIEFSYCAGIVDGEGCLRIDKFKSKNNKNSFRLILKINNTDPRLISYIYEIFKCGSVRKLNGKKYNINRRNQFEWNCTSKNVENVLSKIYPYLTIKKNQADIAFEFRKTYGEYYSKSGVPKNILEYRKYLFKKISELKH